MGDIVADGAEFSCPFCTGSLKLKVTATKMQGESKKLANKGNCFFPPPGGNCIVVPSAPVPCTPAAVNTDPGQSPVKIQGLPALGKGCKFQCAKGGLITLSDAGQGKAHHDGASGVNLEVMEVAAIEQAGLDSSRNAANDASEMESDKRSSADHIGMGSGGGSGNGDDSSDSDKKPKKNPKKEERRRSRAASTEEGGAQRKTTPRNNQAQNKMARDAKKEIERYIERRLTDDEIRQFHDAVTGQNCTYEELIEIGDMFKKY